MKLRASTVPIVLVLWSAATFALARSGDHEAHSRDGGSPGRGHGQPISESAENDEEDEKEDAGARAKPNLTPAQSDFRDKLVEQQRLFVRELARSRGKPVGLAERQAIGIHWRHVMRLLRIRELAERDNDTAIVQRVDELRDREDQRFVSTLQEMADAGATRVDAALQ